MNEAAKAIDVRRAGRALSWLNRTLGDRNPVLVREVLSVVRLRSVKITLVAIPLLLTGLLLLVAEATSTIGSAPAEHGGAILSVGVTAALYVISLIGAVLGAQAISGERQGDTLDVLLATGMSPWQIVMGKVTAIWAVLALMLFICLPAMGIVFVVGGVALSQLVGALVSVLLLSLVPVSIGFCLGAMQRSGRLAVGGSVVLVGAVAPVIFSLLWMVTLAAIGVNQMNSDWMFFFPATVASPWRGLVGGVLLPTYLIVIPSWFLLAIAVHTLASTATDRSRSLRVWMMVAGPAGALLVGALAHATDSPIEGAILGLGCLGIVLSLGALALAAHPKPRQGLPPGALWKGIGPLGGANLAFIVALVSLLIAAALLSSIVGVQIAWAAAILLAFVILILGGGVFFASLTAPQTARLALFGLMIVATLLPLVIALVVDLVTNWHLGSHDPLVGLSPLGAYFDLAASASQGNGSSAIPELSVAFWSVVGLSLWIVGAARLRQKRPRTAVVE